MFFRQIWFDPRLAYGCHYKRDFVTLGAPILSQIWLPDTYFEYETKSQLQSKSFYLTLQRSGRLILSTRFVLYSMKTSLLNTANAYTCKVDVPLIKKEHHSNVSNECLAFFNPLYVLHGQRKWSVTFTPGQGRTIFTRENYIYDF